MAGGPGSYVFGEAERKEVMEIVKSAAADKTLIAHVGSINQAEAEELGEYAAKLGYDAVSSVTPFYYSFTLDEIKNYYLRIADRSALPMFIYYIPSFSGVSMSTDEISSFLSDDRFAGIKFTSNDFFTMERCKTNFPDKIIYNGFDEMFLSGLSMGADGAIGSTYNFMADKFVQINKLFQESKMEEAMKLQREANRIISVLCGIGVIPADKEVMHQLLGCDFEKCRLPFNPLTDEQKELIKKEIILHL